MTGPQWRGAVVAAAVTMAAVLGSLATTLLLREVTAAPEQVSVLAVVLSVTLGRTADRGVHLGLETIVELAALSFAASGVAWLLFHDQSLGQTLLVVGLSIGILARRFDGWLRRAGRVVALPFLAILITPVAAIGTTSTRDLLLWSPVGAVVAALWTSGVRRLLPSAPPTPEPRRRLSARRIDVSTRMGLQMLVGLAAAMVLGRLLFDQRWAWCVLSAFIVASGNRGRGDVVHKASLRIAGAAIGTLAATTATLHVPAGHRSTLVALFAVMTVALVLRVWSYAFWAAGMTAMLSLLHAYYGSFGQSPAHQLGERLVGVAIGSVLGVLAAWLVLPVRTREVFRGRVVDCLRALTDALGDEPPEEVSLDWSATLVRLNQLRPTLRAAARHHSRARRQLAAIDALRGLVLPSDDVERRILRRDVVRVRRSLVGKDDPALDELAPPLRPVLDALRASASVASRVPAPSPTQGVR